MVATVQEAGSSPLPAHQVKNLLHLHPYCRRVDGACAFVMVDLTVSVHSVKSGSGPAVVNVATQVSCKQVAQ